MDSRKSQTSTASLAEPEAFPDLFKHPFEALGPGHAHPARARLWFAHRITMTYFYGGASGTVRPDLRPTAPTWGGRERYWVVALAG